MSAAPEPPDDPPRGTPESHRDQRPDDDLGCRVVLVHRDEPDRRILLRISGHLHRGRSAEPCGEPG